MKKYVIQHIQYLQFSLIIFQFLSCFLLLLYLNHAWVQDCITIIGIMGDEVSSLSPAETMNRIFADWDNTSCYQSGFRYLQSAGYGGIGRILLYKHHWILLLASGMMFLLGMEGLIWLGKLKKKQVKQEKKQLLQWVQDRENLHIETFWFLQQGGIDGELLDAVRNLKLTGIRKQNLYEEDRKQILQYMEDISHHLKTPLAVIRTVCERILYRNQFTEEMENCMTQVEQMSGMISDLLKLGRYDYGKLKLKMRKVSIGELIESIGQDMDVLLMKKNLELEYHGEDTEDWYCDPDQIREAIENLVKNCIEHSQDGVIRIKTESIGSTHHLMIQDCGTGFAHGEEAELFERYSMGSRRAKDSSGLGLAITARIMELHYGRVRAENGEMGGAVFHLYLPGLEDEAIYREEAIV